MTGTFMMVLTWALSLVVGVTLTCGLGYALWLNIRRNRAELKEGTQTQLQYRILDEIEAMQTRFDIAVQRLESMERRLPPAPDGDDDEPGRGETDPTDDAPSRPSPPSEA